MNLRSVVISLLLLPLAFPAWAQEARPEDARNYLERASEEPDNKEALYFYGKALDLYRGYFEKTAPEEIPDQDYWDAATCAVYVKDRDYLTTLVRTVLDRTVATDGVESEAYALALQEASRKCLLAGDRKQAKRLLKRSGAIYKSVGTGQYGGRDMDSWRDAATIEALIHWQETRYGEAERLAERLLREEKKLKDNEYNIYQALVLAANIASDGLLMRKAGKYSKEAFYMASPMVVQAFNQMSEAARDRYWRKNRDVLEGNDNPRFDYLLLSKGILLKASKDFNDLVRDKGDSLSREMLAKLNAATIAGAPADTLEAMDQRLVDYLAEIGVTASSAPEIVNQKQIQAAMNPDDVVIEFYSKKGGYTAVVLKKYWKEAEYVPCGWLVNGTWPNELLKYFPAGAEGRVFFSADGALNNLGIEYFPFRNQGPVADYFPVYRLSSTREIIPSKETRHGNVAGLYGGALYDLKYPQRLRMLDSLRTGSTRNLDLSVSSVPEPDDNYEGLKPLPKTLSEIQAIDSILCYAGVSVDAQTGAYASEEMFKDLSPRENYLHVATHGFYVHASELDKHPYFVGMFGLDKESISRDPLLRTGLYLSGANQTIMGVKGNYEDGVLTAKEISMMDLRGVELVVLSACKTGIGESGTDGAFGLQRAFKKAGVQSIVMSIRKVEDASTAQMMKYLYENRYLLGMSLHDAFYAAVRQLKDGNAFILLDAYSPLL